METDSQLQMDVGEELKGEPQVTASDIGVEVKDGVVTLSGEVSSYGEKWNAERAAQRVSGVNALAIDLKVRLSSLGGRTDADIARSAGNVLSWSVTVPKDSVKVMVEKGLVTLTGDVDWQFQRLAAAACVRSLTGVTGISDQIAIKPKLTVSAVKGDIEAALKRSSIADAKKIHVEVNGSDCRQTPTETFVHARLVLLRWRCGWRAGFQTLWLRLDGSLGVATGFPGSGPRDRRLLAVGPEIGKRASVKNSCARRQPGSAARLGYPHCRAP